MEGHGKADEKHEERSGELLGPYALESEVWREYDFCDRIYRIESPKLLYFRKSGSTHRVVDINNIVHCVPAPGHLGCVLRWKSKQGDVKF